MEDEAAADCDCIDVVEETSWLGSETTLFPDNVEVDEAEDVAASCLSYRTCRPAAVDTHSVNNAIKSSRIFKTTYAIVQISKVQHGGTRSVAVESKAGYQEDDRTRLDIGLVVWR